MNTTMSSSVESPARTSGTRYGIGGRKPSILCLLAGAFGVAACAVACSSAPPASSERESADEAFTWGVAPTPQILSLASSPSNMTYCRPAQGSITWTVRDTDLLDIYRCGISVATLKNPGGQGDWRGEWRDPRPLLAGALYEVVAHSVVSNLPGIHVGRTTKASTRVTWTTGWPVGSGECAMEAMRCD